MSIVVGITGIEPIKVYQIQEPPLYLSLFPFSFLLSQAKRIKTLQYESFQNRTERGNRTPKRPTFVALPLCNLSRYFPTLISQSKQESINLNFIVLFCKKKYEKILLCVLQMWEESHPSKVKSYEIVRINNSFALFATSISPRSLARGS